MAFLLLTFCVMTGGTRARDKKNILAFMQADPQIFLYLLPAN